MRPAFPHRERREEAPAPEEQVEEHERPGQHDLQDEPGDAEGDHHLLAFNPDAEEPMPDEVLEDAYQAARSAFTLALSRSGSMAGACDMQHEAGIYAKAPALAHMSAQEIAPVQGRQRSRGAVAAARSISTAHGSEHAKTPQQFTHRSKA